MTKKVHKESSDAMSKLASRALRGEKLTDDEIKSLGWLCAYSRSN